MIRKMVGVVFGLLLASTAIVAQTNSTPWDFQFQTGYNTSSKWLDSGWLSSAGLSYSFNNDWALRGDLAYYEGKVKDRGEKDHVWTLMFAPQYTYKLNEANDLYFFAGLGVAKRDSLNFMFDPSTPVSIGSETKWAGEAGFGYRHFFNKNIGMSLQATYNHFAFSDKIDNGDVRVGIVARF